MTTLQITFVSESAGYRNTLGYYNKRTGEVEIIFLDTNDDGRKAGVAAGDSVMLDVEQSDIDAGNIGFFIIPNGADIYGTGNKSKLNGPLSFEIEADSLEQAVQRFGQHARDALNSTMQRLEEMRREQASSLIVPGGSGAGGPAGGFGSGGGLQLP